MRGQCQLPSLILPVTLFELLIKETFSEVVGPHFSGRTGLDDKKMSKILHVIWVMAHMLPEPVPLDQEVLGVIGNMLLGGKLMGSMVVLEDSALHTGKVINGDFESRCHFEKEVMKRDESLKTHTQG